MNELASRYEVTRKDLARGRNMKIGAWTSPFLLSALPAAIFLILSVLSSGAPVFAISFFLLGVISTIIGFVIGLIITSILAYKHSVWTTEMRERIAADGIKAEEIGWFKHELKSVEKKALKEIEAADLLLADAYRETLASRLTATRIVKSSKRQLLLARKRQNKLKYLKSEKSENFQEEVKNDVEKISSINEEAKQMLVEAETRLQMIEAAAVRGHKLADSELALKKLSARTSELPLALESAKIEEEIRRELEKEPLD